MTGTRIAVLMVGIIGILLRFGLPIWEKHHSPDAVGIDLLEHGKPEQAIAAFNQMLSQHPGDFEALANRAKAYGNLKQYDNALQDYNAAARIEPNNKGLRLSRGILFEELHRYNQAIAEFSFVISLDNKSEQALVGRSLAYMAKNDISSALTDVNSALTIKPSSIEALIARAVVYNAKQDYDLADRDLADAEKSSSDIRSQVKTLRSEFYLSRGEFDKAIAEASRPLGGDSEQSVDVSVRASAEFGLMQWVSAANYYRASLALDQDNAEAVIMLHLANIKMKVDDSTEFQSNITKLHTPIWPVGAIQMFNGRMPPQQLLSILSRGPETTPDEMCDAHFYAAEYWSGYGHAAEAISEFQTAVAACPPASDNLYLSRVELTQLVH